MIPTDERGVPEDSEVLDCLERVKMGLNQMAGLEVDGDRRRALADEVLGLVRAVAHTSYTVGLRDGAEADELARQDEEERRDMFAILRAENPTLSESLWGRKTIMGGLQLFPERERAQTWMGYGITIERRDEWDIYPVTVTRRRSET